jgi:hypothetical protein
MVFYAYNRKKNYAFLPPPPFDELLDELSGKNFLGHLKKNIVQRNVAIGGWKKIRAQKNCPTPPLKYLMVRP